MKVKVPYLVAKPGANGVTRWFWQPSSELRKLGWRPERLDATTLDQAAALAAKRNAELAAWRKGDRPEGAPPPAREVRADTVAHVIRLYKASTRFTEKAPKTRYDYALNLKLVEDWAGDAPVRALDRATVQAWYEAMRSTGKLAKANAALRVLRLLLKFAWDNGFASENAASRPGLTQTAPRLRVWTDAEVSALTTTADRLGWPSIADAVIYGVHLGQRQGDLLRLRHAQVTADRNGGWRVHLRQAKRGALVEVPLHPVAASRYAASRERGSRLTKPPATILWNEQTGQTWNADTFRHTFSEVRAEAAKLCPSIADAWFMDTRDTAVTRLAQAGCTIPEICAITGHNEVSAHQVLKHYLALNGAMADSAIAKVLAWEEGAKARDAARS